MKSRPFILGVFFAAVAVLFIFVAPAPGFWGQTAHKNCPVAGLDTKTLFVRGKAVLTVEIAETAAARICGLSHREKLPRDRGMLFVFPENGFHGIWMREMRFPIDIAWLDEGLTVVDIVYAATPGSYPETFHPRAQSRYVLEVPAGTLEKSGIAAGYAVTVVSR